MSDINKTIRVNINNGSKEWSYTMEKDDMTKTCSVVQAENGYIVKINKYGRSVADSEYVDESKEFIMEENPLEAENLDASISDAEALGNIMQMKQVFGNFNY